MNRILLSAVLTLMALAVPGCIYVSNPPERTVVRETRVVAPASRTVITNLPPGYRVRPYRGVTYYEVDNVYYRAQPGGYLIVDRPW
jgi:hypothetical protein